MIQIWFIFFFISLLCLYLHIFLCLCNRYFIVEFLKIPGCVSLSFPPYGFGILHFWDLLAPIFSVSCWLDQEVGSDLHMPFFARLFYRKCCGYLSGFTFCFVFNFVILSVIGDCYLRLAKWQWYSPFFPSSFKLRYWLSWDKR